MSHAFIYPTSALATVYDGDQLWVFDLKEGSEPKLVPDFHVKTRTLILGQSERVEDAGAYPYPAVGEKLRLEYFRRNTLRLILKSLDRECTMDLRKDFADLALILLDGYPVIRSWIVGVFTESPLRQEGADFDGLPNEQLKQFLAPFWRHTLR